MNEIWTSDGGVFFGYGAQKPRNPPPPIQPHGAMRYVGDRHLVTVGPNGSGKSTNLLLPNLAGLPNWSVLVIDPKGDLARRTLNERKQYSRIVMLNPFDEHGLGSDGYNPVAALDPRSDNFPDDAMGLAEALIRVEGHEPHWSASAQDLVCALIMYVRLVLPNPSLGRVRTLLGMSGEQIRDLATQDVFSVGGKDYPGIKPAADIYQCEELVTKLTRFADFRPENRELSTIMSTALTQTRWLDSRQMRRDLEIGDFDFLTMKEEPTTVYLILPANRLGSHSTWLRLMITSILQPLMRDTYSSKVPVLFMLDEFAQLGRLPVIERTMALMRDYGVKLWTVVQDLSQLKDIYHDRWESFLGNAGVLQSYAPQDIFTSKYLSDLTGLKTFTPLSASKVGPRAQFSASQIERPLMLPQDVRGMEHGYSLLFSHKLKGTAALTFTPNTYEQAEYAHMFQT